MKLSELTIGSLLEIYIRRDGYNYKVISKIEYADDKRVGVTPIASRRMLFRFKSTDMVDIVYKTPEKTWRWEKVKAGLGKTADGTRLHVFEPKQAAEIFNRRSTYRLAMSREILLNYEVPIEPQQDYSYRTGSLISMDDTLKEISEQYRESQCRAFLKNISEGGAGLSTDEKLYKGDIVSFSIPFGETRVTVRGVIIRTREDEKAYYKYHYGISFIETSANFVQFIYAEQRNRLAQGKRDYNTRGEQ